MRTATLRIHGCARELVPRPRLREPITVEFELPSGLRDIIQSTGVPHVELGQVRLNGRPVGYSARVDDGDEIEAWSRYPLSKPPSNPAFLLDVHLGRLAHYLRLFGFDAEHHPGATDPDLAEQSAAGRRILLTRDRGLLMRRELWRASFVRTTDPREQIVEVLHRFALTTLVRPLTRCLECNGSLQVIAASEAISQVPVSVSEAHDDFSRCPSCQRIYWKGSHYRRMLKLVEQTLADPALTR